MVLDAGAIESTSHTPCAVAADGTRSVPATLGRPYFVMELVKGVPLTKYCDEHRLTLRERLELFVPVCQAIQHAHQKGIIHRDIKPSNVLVALYDGKPVPKVIDFGIAKATEQQLTEKTLVTGFGNIVGTLEYMSPEQAELNQLDIDTRSDIYSLGVLLYELLTGTTPLERKRLKQAALLEVLRLIREEEPPRPSARLSTTAELPAVAANRGLEPKRLSGLVRGELDWIVMKALDKDRNRRYETANGFALDVQRYLADEPVQACPPSIGYRFGKFARRNKGKLFIAACVFLAVAVMAASIGWAVRDRAARESEIERRETVRQTKVESQVRDSMHTARTLIADNKLAAARQKLIEAKAQLGNDRSALGELLAEVDAAAAALDRFEQFLDLVERAHDAETGSILESAPAAAPGRQQVLKWARQPATAIPFLLQALALYQVLDRHDWNSMLERGLLEKNQVEQVRGAAYEELLWLADDLLHRQQDHQSDQQLSPEAAARKAVGYLENAESASRPTRAFFTLRSRCLELLGDKEAAQADRQRGVNTPPTRALDHVLLARAAMDDGDLALARKEMEAALRLEPTHYWSLLWLGYSLVSSDSRDLGAVNAFTGCILKRSTHALAYQGRAFALNGLRRHDDALEDLNKALALDPKNARAWASRGYTYSQLRQYEKELSDSSRAIELDPMLVAAWNTRGSAHSSLRQHDKAIADYTRAIELAPKLALLWSNRGSAYNDIHQYEKALADCARATDLDPKSAIAWNNRGISYNGLQRYEEALADFSRAIELDSKNALWWHNRGNVHSAMNLYDKAIADYSRAIELEPKFAAPWSSRGKVYDGLQQYEKALADCTRAVELEAEFAGAWNNRGNANKGLRRYEDALADYSRAIELDPNDASYGCNRGNTYFVLHRYEKALADYSRAIAVDSKYVKAWNNRGTLYFRLGQYEKALADFTKAIELDPKHVSSWSGRGIAQVGLRQYDKALADYSRAIEVDSKYAPVWNYRGALYFDHLGQYEKALADYSRAIELDPKDASYHCNRGKTYYVLGQYEKALADYTNAIELDPKHAPGWTGRGIAQVGLRQYEKALADYSRAIEVDSKYAMAWNNRGALYCDHLRHYEKALADFAEAIKLDAKFAGPWAGSGIAYGKLKRWGEAIAHHEKALQLHPDRSVTCNELAWLLATCPDEKFRDPARAVELAKKAIAQAPMDGGLWNTLGVAQYRAGDWQASVDALEKSMKLRKGGDSFDWFWLAMAQAKLGNKAPAQEWHQRAVAWMEKNQPNDHELRRFRSEAEDVLELKKK
jgi:tetratricopeptide (TPR) repeat protein